MVLHGYDEALIRSGELILDLDFVESYHEELEKMNRDTVGAPYQLTDNYMRLLEAVRYLTCTGCNKSNWRALPGACTAWCPSCRPLTT
jgi:hypothetical protein